VEKPSILINSEGTTVDRRCKAARAGIVTFLSDGRVDPSCPAV